MYSGHQGNGQIPTPQMGRPQQILPGNQPGNHGNQVVCHTFNNHNGQSAQMYYQRNMTSQMTSHMNGMTSPVVTGVPGRRGNQQQVVQNGHSMAGNGHVGAQMVQNGGHGNQVIHHNGRGFFKFNKVCPLTFWALSFVV